MSDSFLLNHLLHTLRNIHTFKSPGSQLQPATDKCQPFDIHQCCHHYQLKTNIIPFVKLSPSFIFLLLVPHSFSYSHHSFRLSLILIEPLCCQSGAAKSRPLRRKILMLAELSANAKIKKILKILLQHSSNILLLYCIIFLFCLAPSLFVIILFKIVSLMFCQTLTITGQMS